MYGMDAAIINQLMYGVRILSSLEEDTAEKYGKKKNHGKTLQCWQTQGHHTWKAVIEKHNRELTRYHKTNCYASSTVIMENTMHKFYPNHPICIVRPSRDGTQ